jgi:hypothetical protein
VKGSDPLREDTNIDAALEEAADLRAYIRRRSDTALCSMILLSEGSHRQGGRN